MPNPFIDLRELGSGDLKAKGDKSACKSPGETVVISGLRGIRSAVAEAMRERLILR